VLGADQAEDLLARVVLRRDAVADVRPVEAGDEHPAVLEAEALDDVAAGGLVGGGGERHARDVREALVEDGDLEVVGAEVVAPLGDAVGLVDREEAQPRAAGQQVLEGGQDEALGAT
jgi:hypothetical protein